MPPVVIGPTAGATDGDAPAQVGPPARGTRWRPGAGSARESPMPAHPPIDSSDEIMIPAWTSPPGSASPARPGGSGPASADAAERELAAAIREYQARSGRLFPTWSEV